MRNPSDHVTTGDTSPRPSETAWDEYLPKGPVQTYAGSVLCDVRGNAVIPAVLACGDDGEGPRQGNTRSSRHCLRHTASSVVQRQQLPRVPSSLHGGWWSRTLGRTDGLPGSDRFTRRKPATTECRSRHATESRLTPSTQGKVCDAW